MTVAPDVIFAFDVRLLDDDGAVIDRGDGDEAMAYIHGHEQIVPGLERALEGKTIGDKLSDHGRARRWVWRKALEQEEMRAPRS